MFYELMMKDKVKFKGLCLTSKEDNATLTLTKTGSPTFDLKYSLNGKDWFTFANSLTNTIVTLTLNTDDKVYLKGTMSNQSSSAYITLSTQNIFDISGNVYSILDENNFNNITDLSSYTPYTFYHLFYNDKKLNKCNIVLPATKLTDNCYKQMFYNCQNLEPDFELPAMDLADGCYYGMFEVCYKLKKAPNLPALILKTDCYRAMFSSCTGLENPPDLPATTLITNCYRFLFNNCASLKYIKLYYTGNFSSDYFTSWVASGISNNGTLYYNGTDTTVGVNAIPSGWTVESF